MLLKDEHARGSRLGATESNGHCNLLTSESECCVSNLWLACERAVLGPRVPGVDWSLRPVCLPAPALDPVLRGQSPLLSPGHNLPLLTPTLRLRRPLLLLCCCWMLLVLLLMTSPWSLNPTLFSRRQLNKIGHFKLSDRSVFLFLLNSLIFRVITVAQTFCLWIKNAQTRTFGVKKYVRFSLSLLWRNVWCSVGASFNECLEWFLV